MAVAIDAFIEEQEIHAFIYHSPDGDIDGYRWRLLLRFPETIMKPERTEWTTWAFCSNRCAEDLVAHWRDTMTTVGHLAQKKPPDEVAH